VLAGCASGHHSVPHWQYLVKNYVVRAQARYGLEAGLDRRRSRGGCRVGDLGGAMMECSSCGGTCDVTCAVRSSGDPMDGQVPRTVRSASMVVERKCRRSTQCGRCCVFVTTSTACWDRRQIGDRCDSLCVSDVDGTVK
jgi:hypothetical protein